MLKNNLISFYNSQQNNQIMDLKLVNHKVKIIIKPKQKSSFYQTYFTERLPSTEFSKTAIIQWKNKRSASLIEEEPEKKASDMKIQTNPVPIIMKKIAMQSTESKISNQIQIKTILTNPDSSIISVKKIKANRMIFQQNSQDKQLSSQKKIKFPREQLSCQGKKADYERVSSAKLTSKVKTLINTYPSTQLETKNSTYSIKNKSKSPSRNLSARSSKSIKVLNPRRGKLMSLNPSDYDNQYMEKLKNYLNFLFKIHFANRISIDLSLKSQLGSFERYKIFIGQGNNSQLVKQMIRKRFWYEIVDKPEISQFHWTQFEQHYIHRQQRTTRRNQKSNFEDRQTIIQRQNTSPLKLNILKKGQNNLLDNTKILSIQDSQKIESFISETGYKMIFPEFQCMFITNHIPNTRVLSCKKSLLKIIRQYYQDVKEEYPYQIIPVTYHIYEFSTHDLQFMTHKMSQDPAKYWLVKPGQYANHGNGISILPASQVVSQLKKRYHSNGQLMTYIIQQYIDPFLYQGRKFDIRHYLLITSVGGGLRGYWYRDGYIRTSSIPFKLIDKNRLVHLTTDVIQKSSQLYGKKQACNKISYNEFSRYLQIGFPHENYSFSSVLDKMKQIAKEILVASYKLLDLERKSCNFEILQFNFLVDADLKPYLIDINNNPSFQLGCPVLDHIIPPLIDQSLKIGLDPFFPPNRHFPSSQHYHLSVDPLKSLKFQCIFDEHSMN